MQRVGGHSVAIVTMQTIQWDNRVLRIIDQTLLPNETKFIELTTVDEVWHAIKTLKVRGAPAIGICAAFGVLVAIRETKTSSADEATSTDAVRRAALEAADYLATSRPTAVNLFWALDRMCDVADTIPDSATADVLFAALEAEALAIFEEDRRLCRAIGRHGAQLIAHDTGVLTHCNAGGLATADYGTALAVMFSAHEQGLLFRAFADETRPLLQGARLTAWELMNAGIDVTLICDNMAAQVMREGKIQLVIVGADRIAANGDTANKIGTYGVAVLAKEHGIPFYVAAPTSTIDASITDGSGIPIEQRDPSEVSRWLDRATAPEGVKVYNPAFDVTPAAMIAGIVTEHGILRPPFAPAIASAMRKSRVRASH